MTLTELQQEVYTITNRPDRVAETLLAVRQATLDIHQKDFFWKDIAETGIQFNTSAYYQSLEFRTILPRFRALKYLRKADAQGAPGAFFNVLTPEDIMTPEGTNSADVCYGAGECIEIRSSTEIRYALIGYYANPNISVEGYSSWVALDHPFAIVLSAAEKVFKMIGKSEEFAAFKMLRDEEVRNVIISNIKLQGA